MSVVMPPHICRIPYHLRRYAHHLRLGQHQSRQRGTGLTFDQLIESHEGAEIRTINWAATARRGGSPLLVNTYYDEKHITVMLLADLSASMTFGSVRLSKQALVAEISTLLVYSALVARDRIGLLGFSSQVEVYLPPRQTRSYQWAIPEAIGHHACTGTTARFGVAVDALESWLKRPALVFFLSDFLTDDLTHLAQSLRRLCARHDLIAMVVADPREEALPAGSASMSMRDLETGAVTTYRFSRKNRQRMAAVAQARHVHLQKLFDDLGIAQVTVTPSSDYGTDLRQLFLGHQKRRRG
jgi:uncharacterized protein (DUF58 family)